MFVLFSVHQISCDDQQMDIYILHKIQAYDTHAIGTSPMAATPAGRESTPEPTAPLIMLNVADAIDCSVDFSSPSLSAMAAAADEDAFMRVTPIPPPRGRVNGLTVDVNLVTATDDFLPIKKVCDGDGDATRNRAVAALMIFIVSRSESEGEGCGDNERRW